MDIFKVSDFPDIAQYRALGEQALMRDAEQYNDREQRQDVLDLLTGIADKVLSLVTDPVAQPHFLQVARAVFISLYSEYSQVDKKAVAEKYGQDIVDICAQYSAFQVANKKGETGEAIKPFLPGVQEYLTASYILTVPKYEALKPSPEAPADIIQQYLLSIQRGCQTLDDENLHPGLRAPLHETQQKLAAMIAAYDGPELGETVLSNRGEIRNKPSQDGPQ